MFKAKIVLNNNGKQTVLEFDNEKEYYDYLETHPEINQTFGWNTNWPSIPLFGSWNFADEINKLVDLNIGRRLWYQDQHNGSARALVKRDLQRIEREEKQKEREAKEVERQKEQRKQELSDAKQLLSDYRSKSWHNPEYVKKLEEEIEQLTKKLKA